MPHQGDGLFITAAQCGWQVALADLTRKLVYLCLPILCTVLFQVGAGVFHKQGLDIVDVAPDLLIVRATTQGHERSGDDVDETPGEFLEGSRITFAGELIGDACRHFGDPREVANGVIAGRDLWKPEME